MCRTIAARRIGEHSRAVWREIGYSDGEVDALIAAGAVGEPIAPAQVGAA